MKNWNEHKIETLVLSAQADSRVADELIVQYLPFIKSETAKFLKRIPDDGQDELSIAMFAFYESAMAYRRGRGAFLGLAAAAIRNRLIDYARKERRQAGQLSLDTPSGDEEGLSLGEQIVSEKNGIEEFDNQAAAQGEIEEFAGQLAEFGISLPDIADNCPKQERTLSACMAVLDFAREKPELLQQFLRTKKVPMAQLALGAGIERKTLERHRTYIAAILLAYTNGFEMIRGHLHRIKRKEVPHQ